MSRRIAIAVLTIAAAGLPSAAAPAALLPAGASAQKAPELELPGVLEDEEEWTRHDGWTRD